MTNNKRQLWLRAIRKGRKKETPARCDSFRSPAHRHRRWRNRRPSFSGDCHRSGIFGQKSGKQSLIRGYREDLLKFRFCRKSVLRIDVLQLKVSRDGGYWNQIVSISKIPKGVIESILILKRFKPDLVVGVGGYSAGPLVTGAWLLGIKIVLHEQNILPGITNRILSRFADRIYVSFNETKVGLNPKKIRVTGNPVRKEILQFAREQKDVHMADSGQRRQFTILILGGSQGAHSINMAVLEAIECIDDKEAYFFVHQTGAQDETG